MFSVLESVALDIGYAGSNGLEPQSWVKGNGTSNIYYGEFDALYMPSTGTINNCDSSKHATVKAKPLRQFTSADPPATSTNRKKDPMRNSTKKTVESPLFRGCVWFDPTRPSLQQ